MGNGTGNSYTDIIFRKQCNRNSVGTAFGFSAGVLCTES